MANIGYDVKLSREDVELALKERAAKVLELAGKSLDLRRGNFNSESQIYVEINGATLGIEAVEGVRVTWSE